MCVTEGHVSYVTPPGHISTGVDTVGFFLALHHTDRSGLEDDAALKGKGRICEAKLRRFANTHSSWATCVSAEQSCQLCFWIKQVTKGSHHLFIHNEQNLDVVLYDVVRVLDVTPTKQVAAVMMLKMPEFLLCI